MNHWLWNVSLILGANVFFIRGIGLEVLGLKDRFEYLDILRLWGWNLIATSVLASLQWALPLDQRWLVPLLLPAAFLALWLLVGLFSQEDRLVLPLLAQTTALGTSYVLASVEEFPALLVSCLAASIGYLVSLILVRELLRFVPDDLPEGLRFVLTMAGFVMASVGLGMFSSGTGIV